MSFPECNILLVKCVDSVNHLLHQLHLTVSQPVLIRDVVGNASLSTRLPTGSTWLKVKLFASGGKNLGAKLGPSWEVDMNRSSHACSKVRWAGVDVSVPFVQHEVMTGLLLDGILHSLDTSCQSVKHFLDVSALLHGDDPQLVLFVDPGQESLVLVVENPTTLRPIPLHTSNLEVGITRHKEEMIINQLLSDLLTHSSEREVRSGEVSLEVCKCLLHEVLNINPLLLGDSGGKSESIDITSDTDTGGVDWSFLADGSPDFASIHVACVGGISSNTMVLLDQWIEHIRKDLVRVPISSINTTMLIVKLHGTSNGLCEGES